MAPKRKASTQPELSGRKRKQARTQIARTIASQTSGKAFSDGGLDVDKFLRAREFEIKALEKGIRRARSSLSSRAFQSVPRELRRRTASHNVKRIPKRLRGRAKQEIIEDNTPTGTARRKKTKPKEWLRLENARSRKLIALKTRLRKEQLRRERERIEIAKQNRVPDVPKNTLQKPPIPKAKFRKRQRFKSWLPTHLFHAKRAHMTPPKEPLWRMTIPLSPTQKCYRPTHRAAHERGGIAWDMSYMSTIGLLGAETSIINLFKSLGIGSTTESCWTSKALKWLSGTRSWEGWSFMHNSNRATPIAPLQVLWRVVTGNNEMNSQHGESRGKSKSKRQVIMRVHPSAFMQLWDETIKAAKIQKPTVSVEDLRFEIGSIELTGPAATEALIGTLWPVNDCQSECSNGDEPENIWKILGSLSSAAQLPSDATISFDVVDPRLHHPPRTIDTQMGTQSQEQLLQYLTNWPIDRSQRPQNLFDRSSRVRASRQLPSQKSINHRKGLAKPGAAPDPLPSDPKIPIVIMSRKGGNRSTGSWIILLPWKCVLPVWYSLMFYPLSTGGTIRFGGLEQKRQLAFEDGAPWFPGDYPGTIAGLAWESLESKKRKANWEARPKGRRVEWENVDLGKNRKGEVGAGWACDWDYLCRSTKDGSTQSPTALQQYPKSQACQLMKTHQNPEDMSEVGLVAIKITMLNRGVASTCARIYRLPSNDMDLWQRWQKMTQPTHNGRPHNSSRKPKPSADGPAHEGRQYLAAMLLADPAAATKKMHENVEVPYARDLIGFVTNGNFNLSEGKGTCIGSVILNKVVQNPTDSVVSDNDFRRTRHLCIVRESGQSHGRLARWELA